MQNHHFRGVFKSRIPAFQNAREPDALSGRFAVAPTGLVDSTLNAAHRAAASVDVAPLGEYMCRGETRKKGNWPVTFVAGQFGEGILLLMGCSKKL